MFIHARRESKGKQKSPGRAKSQAEVVANPWHQEEEKKSQINMCIAMKQLHDKHKYQFPLPQARWSKC